MKAAEFKSGLKEAKAQLKGLTIQLRAKNGGGVFHNLREFGAAVLAQESKGMGFFISTVWTEEGIQYPKTFENLLPLLKSGKVEGVAFVAKYEAKDFCDYLENVFGTNV